MPNYVFALYEPLISSSSDKSINTIELKKQTEILNSLEIKNMQFPTLSNIILDNPQKTSTSILKKVINKYKSIKPWLFTKDSKYYDKNSESGKLRKDWETWLGIDIFHPYYKYKEARKIFKNKTTFETPSILPRMKCHPEYKDGQVKVTFTKKF